MKVELVYNPNAGSGEVGGPELVELIRAAGHDASGRSTGGKDWEERLRARARHVDLVAVAGGDGTVRDVLTALVGTGSTVGIIATGTANNIAHTLGTPIDDPEAAIAVWTSATARPFDLPGIRTGSLHDRFVESVGGGVFADLLEVAGAREERTGEDGGTRDGLRMLRDVVVDAPKRRWEIRVDDVDRSGAYLAVEVLNTPRVGPNVELSPGSDPGDGLLDLVLLGASDRDTIVEYIDHLLVVGPPGGSATAPGWEVHRGRRIRIRAPDGSAVHLDDEPLDPEEVGDPSGGWIELAVTGEQLRVLVPGPTDDQGPASQ